MATITPLASTQNDQEEDQQGIVTGSQTPSQNTTTGSTGASSGNQFKSADKKPKGSGRFTNINKYLNANQGGGQQIASAVGGKINKNLNSQAEKTKGYNTQLNQNIDQATQANTLAGQQNQQLQQIGENIENNTGLANQNKDLGINAFTQDPNFGKFQSFQSGKEVNENLLGVRQQDLANAAAQYTQDSQQALQNLATQSGRFGLLKDSFGGNRNPQYSTGQQRLDEIFFAREGADGIRSGVQDQLNTAQGFQQGATSALNDVRNLASQEQQLMTELNDQSVANADAYVDMLSSYIPEINESRNQQWEDLEKTTKAFIPQEEGTVSTQQIRPFTQEELDMLGVSGNTEVYDTFDSILSARDFADKGADATSFADVANQQNVDSYNELAKIANLAEEDRKIKEASTLGAAYASRTDEKGLANRLREAAATFDDRLFDNRSRTANDTGEQGVFDDTKLSSVMDKLYDRGGVFDRYNLNNSAADRTSKEGIDAAVNEMRERNSRGRTTAGDISLQRYLESVQRFYDQNRRAGKTLGG